MGFFDGALGGGLNLGGMVGGAAGGLPGMLGGNRGPGAAGALGKMLRPEIPKSPPPPEIDPRLKEIRDRQFGLSEDFRKNAPGLQSQQENQATDQSRLDLNARRGQIGEAASSRGLLYSGLRKADEAGAAQTEASKLAQKRAGIAKDFQQQQKELEAQAFDSGARLQDLEQKRFDTIYNQDMEQRRQQLASNTSPMGIAGGVLGSIGGLFG